MRLLNRLSNNRDERSLASQLRRRRFRFFRSLFDPLPRPLRLLDVGGTRLFWQQMGFADEAGVEIVLLNHQAGELALRERDIGATHFVEHIGDARAMPEFGDHSFDVVFSNSVLEHVGTFEDQQRMMAEVRRVGKRYFVQTPNYYFPLEPHFLVPGFQFLPLEAKIWLLRSFSLGWTERIEDREAAAGVAESVRLLTERELRQLVPEAAVFRERMCGLTKSFIAYDGWE